MRREEALPADPANQIYPLCTGVMSTTREMLGKAHEASPRLVHAFTHICTPIKLSRALPLGKAHRPEELVQSSLLFAAVGFRSLGRSLQAPTNAKIVFPCRPKLRVRLGTKHACSWSSCCISLSKMSGALPHPERDFVLITDHAHLHNTDLDLQSQRGTRIVRCPSPSVD